MDSRYCYPGTDVLKNKFNITDKKDLFYAEVEVCSARAWDLEKGKVAGRYDLSHLLNIHKYFFEDLYDWAGQLRTVDISKGNSFFCLPPYIESSLNELFSLYYDDCYKNKDNKELFISTLAEHYATLNAIHPFREGNGRTQREFARELCLECGYIFDLYTISHEEMLDASIDGMVCNTSKLKDIFSRCIYTEEEYRQVSDEQRGTLNILTYDDLNEENDYSYDEGDEYEL